MTRLSCATIGFGLLLLLTAGAHANDLPAESAWVQHWRASADDGWTVLGVMMLQRQGERVQAQPLAATYTSAGVTLPDGLLSGEVTASGVRFSGTFGKKADPQTGRQLNEDLVIEFRLERDGAGALAGSLVSDGKEVSQTRLLPLPDKTHLLREFVSAARRWRVERASAEAAMPVWRELADFLQKQLDDDRRIGRQGLQGQSTLVLDDARRRLMVQELRLQQAVRGEASANELALRLLAAMPAGVRPAPPVDLPNPLIESYWKQHWQNPQNGQWIALGVVYFGRQGEQLSGQPLSPTFTFRGSNLPIGPLRGSVKERQVSFSGNFGKKVDPATGAALEQDHILEFRLRLSDDQTEMTGAIVDDGREAANTRFVLIKDKAGLVRELEEAESRWQVERAVAQGTIPGLRDQVSVLEKEDQQARAGGNSGLPAWQRVTLDHARRSILTEEMRLTVCAGGIVACRDIAIRLRDLMEQEKAAPPPAKQPANPLDP